MLLYEDEAVFQQAGTLSRTWALKGIGTEVKSEPCRKSVKAFGAVNVTDKESPRWHFHFAETFNSGSFIEFLTFVLRRYEGQKVFMILDNVRYHYAGVVKEWLEARKDSIKLFFLPPYSPEFNATECVWRLTKRKATHNVYFPSKQKLHSRLFRRFNRYQGNPNSLRDTVKGFAVKYTGNVRGSL